ncbi:hypothetical protein SPFM14_00120 [Salmonella phage SPFM14]|nr:hypothetical protein SPFM14_00120 [Salmonella phage SPFM14]
MVYSPYSKTAPVPWYPKQMTSLYSNYCNYFIYYDPTYTTTSSAITYQGLYRNGYQSTEEMFQESIANRRRVLYHTAPYGTRYCTGSIRRLMQHAFQNEYVLTRAEAPETMDDLTGYARYMRFRETSSNSMSVTLYLHFGPKNNVAYLAQEKDVERYYCVKLTPPEDMGNLRRPFFWYVATRNNNPGLDPDMRGEYRSGIPFTIGNAATDNPYDLYAPLRLNSNSYMTQFIAALSASVYRLDWSMYTQQIINIPMGIADLYHTTETGAWEPMDVYSTDNPAFTGHIPISFIREEPSSDSQFAMITVATGDRTVAIKFIDRISAACGLVLTADDLTYHFKGVSVPVKVPYRATSYRDKGGGYSGKMDIYYDRLNLSQCPLTNALRDGRNSRIVVNGLHRDNPQLKKPLNATNVALLQEDVAMINYNKPVMQLVWDQIR